MDELHELAARVIGPHGPDLLDDVLAGPLPPWHLRDACGKVWKAVPIPPGLGATPAEVMWRLVPVELRAETTQPPAV